MQLLLQFVWLDHLRHSRRRVRCVLHSSSDADGVTPASTAAAATGFALQVLACNVATAVEQLWISMVSANIWCCCTCCCRLCQVSLLVFVSLYQAAAQVCPASCSGVPSQLRLVSSHLFSSETGMFGSDCYDVPRLSGLKRFSETFKSLHLVGRTLL